MAVCPMHSDDVVVAHAGQSARLVQKVGWLNAAFRFGLEKLQRNGMIEPGVVRMKDLTVRAFADLAHQEQMAPHTKVRRRRRAGWRKAPSGSGTELWQDSTSARGLDWKTACPHGRRGQRGIFGECDLIDLRSMDFRDFRDQPELPDQRA